MMNLNALPTVALTMIAKDEEASIGRALKSVKAIVDEMVVVDTGSTDRTKEIASAQGARVIEFKWCDDFAAARNAAMDEATSEWLLTLDADEELVAGAGSLPPLLGDDGKVAYLASVFIARDASREAGTEHYSSIRLLRSGVGIRWEGEIHEEPAIGRDDAVGESSLSICHFGPVLDRDEAPGKRSERNIRILEKVVAERPGHTKARTDLGTELFFAAEFAKSAAAFDGVIAEVGTDDPWTASHLRFLALSRHELGEGQAARVLLARLQAGHPRFTDLFFLEAEMALLLGERRRALELLTICQVMGEPPRAYWSWGGCGGWRAEVLAKRAAGERMKDPPPASVIQMYADARTRRGT